MADRALALFLLISVLGLAALVAGCDQPLPTEAPPASPRLERTDDTAQAGLAAEAQPFLCTTRALIGTAPEAYDDRVVVLPFAASVAEAAGHRTRSVVYRLYGADGRVVREATCVIPDAPGAEATLRGLLALPEVAERGVLDVGTPAQERAIAADRACQAFGANACWQVRHAERAETLAPVLASCDDPPGGGGGDRPPPNAPPPGSSPPPPPLPPPLPPPGGGSGGPDDGNHHDGQCPICWDCLDGPGDPDDPIVAGGVSLASCTASQLSVRLFSCGGGGQEPCIESVSCPPPDDLTEEEVAYLKLVRVLNKARQAAGQGKDLFKKSTWRDIAEGEWAELVDCVASIVTFTPDLFGVLGLLDCAIANTAGFDAGDAKSLLKSLGLWDNLVEAVAKLDKFWHLLRNPANIQALKAAGLWEDLMDVARAMGRFPAFVHSIDDLDVLYEVANLDIGHFNVPQILEAQSLDVAHSFLQKWGNPQLIPIPGKPSGSWRATAPDGTVLTRYPSSTGDPGRWTLQFRRPDGSLIKIRFGW